MFMMTTHDSIHLPRWAIMMVIGTLIMSVDLVVVAQTTGLEQEVPETKESPSHPLRFFQTKEPRSTSNKSLPIREPSPQRVGTSANLPDSEPRSAGQAITTILSALTIVLGTFFLVVWLTRSAHKRRWAPLPNEAIQILGRAPLAGRQWMQLMRIGNKLVLVSVSTNQVDTITEVTDPQEVEQLVAVCRQSQAGSFRQTFQQVLNQTRQNGSHVPSSAPLDHQYSHFVNTK